MASKTSKPDVANWPGRTLDFVEYGRALAERRAAYEAKHGHPPPASRNSGARRTESKKALLAAINEITEKQGWRW
jgi:hypothetical protein